MKFVVECQVVDHLKENGVKPNSLDDVAFEIKRILVRAQAMVMENGKGITISFRNVEVSPLMS